MRKVIKFFTQGKRVPSTRFRVSQLRKNFEANNILIEESHAYKSAYPPKGFLKRVIWLLLELFSRAKSVFFMKTVDAVIFQREMISTLYTFEHFVKGKKILDVDDAVWLKKNGRAINKIASRVDYIVCGNSYLANYFSRFKKPIAIIPTAVDTSRFKPSTKKDNIIGWSGGSSAFHYLYAIESQLAMVLKEHKNWKFRVLADSPPLFTLIPNDQIEFIKWSPEIEVEAIATMSIGLMPLDDEPWSKGKCSYKMLLYMACGLPVVVSNVGMNRDVLELSNVGFGVDDNIQWNRKINDLIASEDLRNSMGKEGRKVVENNFSLEVVVNKWKEIINNVVK